MSDDRSRFDDPEGRAEALRLTMAFLRAAAISILDFERLRRSVASPLPSSSLFSSTLDRITADARAAQTQLDAARERLSLAISALPHTEAEMALSATADALRSAELRDVLRAGREALPFGHSEEVARYLLAVAYDIEEGRWRARRRPERPAPEES